MESPITAPIIIGSEVDIMLGGEWEGPYTVVALTGRTPDHLVLKGNYNSFEIYNDAPFNVQARPVK